MKHNLEKIITGYGKKVYYKNDHITSKNFPVPETVATENLKVITMPGRYTSEEALAEIKKQKCRPANIYELLLWSKDNQEKGTWVSALGSDFVDADGRHRVPSVLARSDGDFKFYLGFFEDEWDADDVLLCVCEKSFDTETLENQTVDPLTLDAAIQVVKEAGYVVFKAM